MHHDQAVLERANHLFRREMWMSVVPDAVDEQGILFFSLPVRDGWRCYTAVSPQPDARVAAAGAMLIEDGVAVLGLDATLEAERGRGCNRALLRRRLLDAAAAGCQTVVAEVAGGEECAGLRHNLLAAGFTQAYAGCDWQRPALRPAVSA